VCRFDRFAVGNKSYGGEHLYCYRDGEQYLNIKDYCMTSLHKSTFPSTDELSLEPFFYGISTRPTGIVELDFYDVENVKVRKLFVT
jgi:hypothetical protein